MRISFQAPHGSPKSRDWVRGGLGLPSLAARAEVLRGATWCGNVDHGAPKSSDRPKKPIEIIE